MLQGRLSAPEIVKLTDRSNCGECGFPTCLAFAVAVLQGRANPSDCPAFDPEAAGLVMRTELDPAARMIDDLAQAKITELKSRIREVSFEEAARRIGGVARDGRIGVRFLGKMFELDKDGEMHAECHVNSWIHFPFLNYVLESEGREPRGEWISFRQWKAARDWHIYFSHRGDGAMHRMADRHTELFLDILDLFGKDYEGKEPVADHVKILYPLPKVPMLVCYTEAEGDFESSLTLLFDKSIESNLPPDAVYLLVQGMLEMFRRIIERHGG